MAGLASPLFAPAGPTQDGGTLALIPLLQSSSSRVITYTYDPLHRLTGAYYSTDEEFHYSYDARGNRLSQTTLSGTTVYTYNNANRLIEVDGQSYDWDDNGNLIDDGTRAYGYDTANRLISVTNGTTTTTFLYNGDGDRVEQTVGSLTTEYVLDPVGLAQVLIASTSSQDVHYVPGLAQYDGLDWEYFATDRLGSVRVLVGPDGMPTLTQSFDPFGNVL